MKFFEVVDFLGKKPTLLIDKQASHKSLLGGLLSLITLTAILFGIGYFASILFAMETFTVVQNEKLDINQTMSISDFPIGVSVVDNLAQEMPDGDRIFEINPVIYSQGSYFNSTLNMSIPVTNAVGLPLEKCDLRNNRYVKYKQLLANELGRAGYCIPPGIDVNITSPVGYASMSILTIWFRKCQNITQIGKNNCYPPEIIDEKLKDIFIGAFFVDNFFDHNNLDNPATPYVRYETMHAGASSVVFRELFIDMKNVDYFTDVNFLVSNPEKVNYNIVDKAWERTTTIKQAIIPGAFTSATFGFGKIRQVYNRKYYKLQNMLADLGGLVKALITITLNINLYFSNKTFFNKVIDANINSLYIKSIRKSLLVDIVGGEGKIRGTTLIDSKGKNKCSERDPEDQDSKTEKRQKEDDVTYDPKYYDQGKNDIEQGSPKKLIHNNKTQVSELGFASERVPVKDEMTLRSEARHARPNSNVELVKLSNDEIEEENKDENKEDQTIANPKSVQIKKNKNVVFKNFQINFCGYLFPGCCFKKGSQTAKQLELHRRFTDIISGHMDILNISKKLHTVDKINYVLCGDQYKKLLETTINPYLYDGALPSSSDIYEAREDIIAALNLKGK